MRRERIFNFGEKRIPDVSSNLVLPDVPPVEEKENPLLNIVYGVDEHTGLPAGDMSFYMSSKTSPEVRQFIIDNLMQPTKLH